MNFKSLHTKIIFSSLFAISMAYLESAVVVYLRELYYPDGFQFPLTGIPLRILIIEIGREAATILMLYAYAKSVGSNGREVMAYFSFNFGVWDIWYYIWLKLLLDWPVTILDWDILFLIPVPWVGPVIAPVIVSLALISAGYIILRFEIQNKPIRLTKIDWIMEIISGFIIILSFLTPMKDQRTIEIPEYYPWWLFLCGLFLGLAVFARRVAKTSKDSEKG
jgi:hypothetical protein